MKIDWLKFAEILDSLRIFPRLFIATAVTAYYLFIAKVWSWFVSIDFDTYDAAQLAAITAFPGVILTALGAMVTVLYKAYQASGRTWSNGVSE